MYDGEATYTEGLSEHRGGVSSYLHADILGSLRLMTQSQSITDTLLYDAFGESVSESNPAPTPYKFVGGKGYQSDADTHLQLLGHRYYNPMIGRFLSVDPIQSGDNWYAYCANDPLGKADPSGEAFRPGGGSDLGGPGDQYDNTPVGDDLHTTASEPPAGTDTEAAGSADGDSNTGGATVQYAGDTSKKPSSKKPTAWEIIQALASISDPFPEFGPPPPPNRATERLPDLTGKTRSEAHKILEDYGFKYNGRSAGGYEKYRHPDGSGAQIRPDGEVVRSLGRNGPRVNQNGRIMQPHEPHSTGEVVRN